MCNLATRKPDIKLCLLSFVQSTSWYRYIILYNICNNNIFIYELGLGTYLYRGTHKY